MQFRILDKYLFRPPSIGYSWRSEWVNCNAIVIWAWLIRYGFPFVASGALSPRLPRSCMQWNKGAKRVSLPEGNIMVFSCSDIHCKQKHSRAQWLFCLNQHICLGERNESFAWQQQKTEAEVPVCSVEDRRVPFPWLHLHFLPRADRLTKVGVKGRWMAMDSHFVLFAVLGMQSSTSSPVIEGYRQCECPLQMVASRNSAYAVQPSEVETRNAW